MKTILTALCFCLAISISAAQNGFSHLFKQQAPFSIATNSQTVFLQNIDSGYFTFCNIVDTPNTTNVLVTKYNNAGMVSWQKEIELPYYIERVRDAVVLPDSNLMLLCTYEEAGLIYDEEVYLIKLNPNGEVINTHFVTNTGICCWDIASGKLRLSKAGKIMLTHQSFGISTANGLVRIMDTNYVYIQGNNDAYALYHADFFQDADSNYLSFASEPLSQLKRASLVKRSNNFNFVWQKHYKHPAIANNKLTVATDVKRVGNQYVLLTNFEDTSAYNNVWIIKTDLNGDTIATKRFINYPFAFAIESHNTGAFVLATNATDSSGKYYLKLVLLDTNFNEVATYNYRYKNFNEAITSFKRDTDGSYLIGLKTDSNNVRYAHSLKVAPDFCITPKAFFNVGYNSGLQPNQSGVVIYNLSDAGIWDASTTITIDMGDGNILPFNTDSLLHIYTTQGTYTVTVTITTVCGSSTYAQVITVACTGQPQYFTSTHNELLAQFNYQGAQQNYNWTFGDGSTSTLQNPVHTYASPGTYYVCLNTVNACGPIELCDSVVVNCAAINIPIASENKACMGTAITLNAGNNGSTFFWSDGSTNQILSVTLAGTYSVTVTNACGVSANLSTNIIYSSLPLIDIGADTIMCIYDNVTISNLPGQSYNNNWLLNGFLQSTGNAFYFSQSSIGSYNITLIADNNGCIDSVDRNITVSPTLICDTASYCIPAYTQGTSAGDYIKRFSFGSINNVTGGTGLASYNDYTHLKTTVTAGQSVTLQFDFNETTPMYYRIWLDYNQDGDFDVTETMTSGAVTQGLTTLLTSVSANAYGGPTRLRIRCANNNNTNVDPCMNYGYGETEDYTIIINNGMGAPITLFKADTMHIYPGDAVNFSDLSYNNPTAWVWTFTGAQIPTSTSKNPAGIIYNNPGCYPVTLQATNNNGSGFKTDTCFILVDVTLGAVQNIGAQITVLPNPFTQQIIVKSTIHQKVTVTIYDINGALIYNSIHSGYELIIPAINWASGLYHINIHNEDGQLLTTKRLLK
ncbi:MAG: PKD domain-containing protein [Bacteroidia bacterium]|nr:PKD domain-containing protein [Bacteroidia bacterium]